MNQVRNSCDARIRPNVQTKIRASVEPCGIEVALSLREAPSATRYDERMFASDRLEGLHCTMHIEELAPRVVLVRIDGTDRGDFGDRPFEVLEPLLAAEDPVELFVDARDARGPSVEVSNAWAQWLTRHRQRLLHVSMLPGSRLVALTARFVQSFTSLGAAMRLFSDPARFEGAMSHAAANSKALSQSRSTR